MAKKVNLKKRAKLEERANVEDLDLDVGGLDPTAYTEEDVVHNRRGGKASRIGSSGSGNGVTAVLPSDAHRLDGYGDDDEHGGYLEEEKLAVATERELREAAVDDDFAVAGVSLGAVEAAAKKKKKSKSAAALDVAPAIEAVERDFANLSTSERLAILKKESPELLRMLDDLKKYLAEVKELAKPLHKLLYERKVSDADRGLVSFLETKVQLMLSYCMHVTFYLLLKSEGKKVAGHPVVDNLVEIRVYLEKMWPLEEKLQYSLNRLLSGKSTAAAHLDSLRPVANDGGELYQATRSVQNTEAKERRQQLRQMREAEELEREEQSTMTRLRTKKATALNTVNLNTKLAPLSYQEDEDQYFAKMTGGATAAANSAGDNVDDDEEEGLSLMEVLRRRQKAVEAQQQQRRQSKGTVVDDDAEGSSLDEGEEDGDDEDLLSDQDIDEDDVANLHSGEDVEDDDEDAEAYDALFEEEAERKRAKVAAATAAQREKLVEAEVERRKAGKKIESHRGLTKSRPKDHKTPRLAQRRKYERGMRVHKAQVRTYQPEPETGFAGVRTLKPGVVRGRKLQ